MSWVLLAQVQTVQGVKVSGGCGVLVPGNTVIATDKDEVVRVGDHNYCVTRLHRGDLQRVWVDGGLDRFGISCELKYP